MTRVATFCLLVCLGLSAACAGPAPQAARPVRAADLHLVPETEMVSGTVPDRSTLADLLLSSKLRADLVAPVISLASGVFDPRRLKAGRAFRLERTLDGLLRRFEYEIDEDRFLRVMGPTNRQPEDLTVELVPFEKTWTTTTVQGTISKASPSLFEAMEEAGEGPDLSLALAEIFGGELDFNTDLQPNDRFQLTFDKVFREGRFSSYGPVLAAEFVNEGRPLKAVRFTVPGAKPDYFDEQGRSLRRFFLASPLKFAAPVSSKVSQARRHPILRIVRPHLGVDYRAPAGSAVVAVANGTVVSAGWNGEAGRLVRLRHASGYETYYMHLSSIAVRNGQHVSQGELVGRVGTSGMSTGPHLDYRVKQNGTFVNPLHIQKLLPPGEPIPKAYLAAFQAERDRLLGTFRNP